MITPSQARIHNAAQAIAYLESDSEMYAIVLSQAALRATWTAPKRAAKPPAEQLICSACNGHIRTLSYSAAGAMICEGCVL